MHGHIRKRNKKSWTLVVELPRDATTGKRRQKRVTVRGTKKNTEKELVRLVNEIQTGSYTELSGVTVGKYLDRWLEAMKENVKPTTLYTYGKHVKQWKIMIGVILLPKLSAMDVQLAMGKFNVSSATKRVLLITLQSALNRAVKWGLLSRNPAGIVDAPRIQQKELCVWAERETNCFLNTVKKTRHYCFFRLALVTGARLGELLGLRWRDIDFEKKTIRITRTVARLPGMILEQAPKTASSRRSVPVDGKTIEVLKKHRKKQIEDALRTGEGWKEEHLVFCNPRTKKPLDPSVFEDAIHRYAQKAGVPDIRFHGLRHTHATLLLRQGVHPKVVAERLGHANVTMTLNRYSHVLPDSQFEAVKAIERIMPDNPPAKR